jgi:GAF domain-containing protein/HAMP domain-containing protein
MSETSMNSSSPVRSRTQIDYSPHTALFRLIQAGAGIGIMIFSMQLLRSFTLQVLVVISFLLVGLVLAQIGYLQHSQGRRKHSVLLTITALVILFAAPILILENAERYLISGGILAVIITSSYLGENRMQRFGAGAVFLLLSLVAASSTLFLRYDVNSSPTLSIFLPTIAVILGLTAIYLLIRHIQRSKIRVRLIASFIIVAVLPLAIAAGAASSIGTRATIDSAIDLMEAVVNLKEAAITSWLNELSARMAYQASADPSGRDLASLLSESPDTERYQTILNTKRRQLINSLRTGHEFEKFLVLDRTGSVVLSTDRALEGMNFGGEPFFQKTLNGATVSPITEIDSLGGKALLISIPVHNKGQLLGVFIGSAALSKLSEIMRQGGDIGQTGEVYLVGSDFSYLTGTRSRIGIPKENIPLTRGAIDAILGKQDGAGTYENSQEIEVIGAYRWLPVLGAAIFAEQSRAEVFSPTIVTIVVNSAISLALIAVTIVFGLAVSNSIGKPLGILIKITQDVTAGNLELDAPVSQRNDEISILASSFNLMTAQLRVVIENLEQRVAERTKEVEARNTQLIIASQLSNTVTTILDVDELVQQVVDLIQDRFKLYYVGLFLVDNIHQYAILKAGTGEAGREMIAKNHRIKLGEGMIGWSILNSKARISQQVAEDPVRLSIAFLPLTQSEAAIPLRSRGQVIGALTIQSEAPFAFDEASIATFQTMADQIAVAIDNARLFEEVQRTLESSRLAYGELSRKAWLERIRAKPLQVVRNEQGVRMVGLQGFTAPVFPDDNSEYQDTENGAIHVPITVRGSVIGYLHAQKPQHQSLWNDEEREMLLTLTEQLGIALESARLFEDTLTRAERERLIGQIANRVRETLDIETVLKTAVVEMRSAMDLRVVEVHMSPNGGQETL